MRAEPRWIGRLAAEIVQHDLILTFGGLPGLRDENLLESALARPRQLWSYAEDTDVPALAAAYAVGLARNHPFNDGNKRIAFVVASVFAETNGFQMTAAETAVVEMMLRLADGQVEEPDLAEWFRASLTPAEQHHSR